MIDLSENRVPGVGDLYGVNQLYGLQDLVLENFDNKTYLCEIGCHSGVSTKLFASMCGKVIGIDKRSTSALDLVIAEFDNLEFVEGLSNEVVDQFQSEEFDAVYIDAQHEYEFVKEDIQNWLPKIKPAGFICGHDYMNDELAAKIKVNKDLWEKMGCNGVRKAVDEVFTNVKVYQDSSWIVNMCDLI